MQKLKFKKNDKVVIIAGKDKGKKGAINKVLPAKSKAIISGINIVKKHTKPSAHYPNGGIIAKEMPIHISNILHEDPKTGLGTRIGYKILESGRKVRYSKRSGELIDSIK